MYGSCGVPRACRAIPDPWFLLSLQKGPLGNNLGKFYWHTKGTLKVPCERCVAPSILSTPCHAGPRHHTAHKKNTPAIGPPTPGSPGTTQHYANKYSVCGATLSSCMSMFMCPCGGTTAVLQEGICGLLDVAHLGFNLG